MSRSRDLQLLHGVVLVWSGAEDAKTASSIVQRHVHSAQHRLICIDPQRSSERPLPPSAWPSNKLGQRGVFAIKWTVLLIHKTPIIKVILVQFPLQSLRTSYVSPGSMTERLWLHPAEVPFSTVAFRETSLAGGLLCLYSHAPRHCAWWLQANSPPARPVSRNATVENGTSAGCNHSRSVIDPGDTYDVRKDCTVQGPSAALDMP